MHRQSIMDDPEAPISHHWLDSTHISEGVVTLGITAETALGGVKVEASRFRGREPDQNRYDIETPNLDSTAVRVAWNPTPTLSLQGSWAHQVSPEQLTPDEDLDRWSASAIYTLPVGTNGFWATTAAWGRRIVIAGSVREAPLDAFVLESTIHPDTRWTVFGRAERVANDELLAVPGSQQGPAFTVAKVSLGAVRDFRVAAHLLFGVGGVVSRSLTPGGLDVAYGGDQTSATGFVRLKLGITPCRSSSSPTAARSPGGSSAPPTTWASPPSRSIPTPMRTPSMSGKRRRRSTSARRRRRSRTSTSPSCSTPRRGRGPTRSTPATASSARTPTSPMPSGLPA